MDGLINQIASQVTLGSTGIWLVAALLALHFAREYRETRKLSLEDRLAKRDGYQRQVEHLMQENRSLRGDISRLHVEYDQYRHLCQEENDQLRRMIVELEKKVNGLERRVATDAITLARMKGMDGI
jgi:DNA repair exonuclease SbcCD ATPase subunit